MAYLRIPESKLASTMSKLLGKSVGNVTSLAQKSLFSIKDNLTDAVNEHADSVAKVNSSIANYNSQVASGKTSADLISEKQAIEQNKRVIEQSSVKLNKQIDSAEKQLNAIEKQMSSVTSCVKSINTLIKSLKVPLKALKATVKVLKALPIPQMYLVVSVTVLYSDLLEMTLELIKQAEELCDALSSVSESLPAQLDSVKQTVRDIREWLNILKLDTLFDDLQDSDRQILEKAGIVDSIAGDSVFGKISAAFSDSNSNSANPYNDSADLGNGVKALPFGSCSRGYSDYAGEKLQKALDSAEFQNKLLKASVGSEIILKDSTVGSFAGQELSSELNNSTDSGSDVGSFGSVTGSWSVSESVSIGSSTGSSTDTVYLGDVGTLKILLLGDSSIDLEDLYNKSGVVRLTSEDRTSFLGKAATRLSELQLSDELKKNIQEIVDSMQISQSESSSSDKKSVFYYEASDGNMYTITVKEDTQYSRLALRHYAEVTDAEGAIVLESPRTFSLDVDILVQDAENRLEQIIV